MLNADIPFPFSGSRGFERETGRPITILRKNPNGTLFVRRDDVPGPRLGRTGRASGNTTIDADAAVASLEETGFAPPDSVKTLAGKPRASRRAKRPATPIKG